MTVIVRTGIAITLGTSLKFCKHNETDNLTPWPHFQVSTFKVPVSFFNESVHKPLSQRLKCIIVGVWIFLKLFSLVRTQKIKCFL